LSYKVIAGSYVLNSDGGKKTRNT